MIISTIVGNEYPIWLLIISIKPFLNYSPTNAIDRIQQVNWNSISTSIYVKIYILELYIPAEIQ